MRYALRLLPLLGGTLLFSGKASAQSSSTSSPPPSQPTMESGGLTPPPPSSGPSAGPTAAPNPTERQLEESDQKDSGRGLQFFYFDVEGGLEQVSLQSLHVNQTLVPSTAKTSDVGALFGVGAGVRLLFITIGPRFRVAHFADWDVWTLNAEVGWHVPLGDLEPYFTLGGGFAKLGNVSTSAVGNLAGNDGVLIRGYNVRAGLGLDYFATNVFSIGASVTGELLGLARPSANFNATACSSSKTNEQANSCLEAQALQQDSSSLGFAITPSVVLGLHF